MKQKVLTLYLDYWNDFLSVSCFADSYGISEKKANRIIEIGRKIFSRIPEKRL